MGGFFLQIYRMNAAFGKLHSKTLELREGLNIIEAPNESGKSTWCAFLLSMFYGINSRERERTGFIPDKIRYIPWAGTVMSGRLDCRVGKTDITLTRATRRQTAPFAEFQAVYSGTGEPIPSLTGSSCGETLLGVSREVFERSAFIRQNGLTITQDAGLERRIASLVTSGEESTSYSEAADTLRKQLNRRRHNRTGQIPALEAQLQETERQLTESRQLNTALTESQERLDVLTAQETALMEELAQQDRWDAACQWQALKAAEAAANQAAETVKTLRTRLEANHVPENETIGRLRGAIVNLESTRKALNQARNQWDTAAKQLLRAEAAVNASPFAGQTAEQAQRAVQDIPTVRPKIWWLPLLLFAAAAGCTYLLTGNSDLLLACILTGIIGALIGIFIIFRRFSKDQLKRTAYLSAYGADSAESLAALADTYLSLLSTRDEAQAEADKCSTAADTLYNTLSSNEQAILLEVRRFAPTAFDPSAADALLRQCAQQRKALLEAETAAQKAQIQLELLTKQAPAKPDTQPAKPPARSRNAVSAELAEVQAALPSIRSTIDRLSGQLQAIGDPVLLQSTAEHLQSQINALTQEYDAIQLAISALDTANAALQSRFSPEVGRRTAEIFGQLTHQRYNSVVLDRAFHLAAEPVGDTIYRDTAFLSAGTVDQLYLAARLAICELVLPAENAIPLILDDALANFDDERCAAALQWLKESAKTRQILLFTCHSREAAFFSGDSEVFVQRLTNDG